MLGLAEYVVISQEILRLGQEAEANVANQLTPGMTKQKAISITKDEMLAYYDNYQTALENGLEEIANNAVGYYSDQAEVDVPEGLANKLVKSAYGEKYYGATLLQRLVVNKKRLERNITRSAQVSQEALTKVITDPIPFGSQYHVDKRVLLATAAKLEQDTAKEFARKEQHPLINWKTSSFHAKPDVCDDLANAVDKTVVSYIKSNKLDIDPRGVYFQDKLPLPPHPNCQCEYGLVREAKSTSKGAVKRTVSTIRNLLRRFKGK